MPESLKCRLELSQLFRMCYLVPQLRWCLEVNYTEMQQPGRTWIAINIAFYVFVNLCRWYLSGFSVVYPLNCFILQVGTNLVNIVTGKKSELVLRELGGCMAPVWPTYFKDCSAVLVSLLPITLLGDSVIGNYLRNYSNLINGGKAWDRDDESRLFQQWQRAYGCRTYTRWFNKK